jgi:hypothetical protein
VNVRWRRILSLIFVLVNVFVSKMLMVIVVIVARKDSSTCSKIIFLVVNVSVEADGDNVALVMEVWTDVIVEFVNGKRERESGNSSGDVCNSDLKQSSQCLACGCDEYGTVGGSCDAITGKCQCKRHVEGEKCDKCYVSIS